MRKVLLFVIGVILLAGCAKAGDPVKIDIPDVENEILIYEDNVPINGYAKDIQAHTDFIVVAEDEGGVSAIDANTHQRYWYTQYTDHSNGSIVQLVKNTSVAYDDENHYLVFNESDEADQIIVMDITYPDDPSTVTVLTGNMSGVRELKVKKLNETIPDLFSVAIMQYQIVSDTYLRRGRLGHPDVPNGEDHVTNLGFYDGVNGQFNLENPLEGFDEDDNFYFIASGQRGIKVLAKADSMNITVHTEFDVSGEALKLSIVDNYLYVACRQEGLKVFQLENGIPVSTEPIYTKSVSGIAVDVAYDRDASGNPTYLALACSSGGVYLFDIHDPANPEYLEKDSKHQTHALSVSMANGKVYVGARDKVVIYNIE
jgi:hypothetical protein